MDGTLVDSREIILGAFKHVLEEFGQTFDEAPVSPNIGRLLVHTYSDLLPEEDIEKVTDLHRSWQAENKHLLKGYHGLTEFLQALKDKNLKLGLFTSATRSRTELAFDGLGISGYFDAVVCGDEVTNPKPDKEGIVKLAEKMDVPLDNVIMVGDAVHDIMSGKNAGVETIGITHGFGTKQALEAAGVDHIVSDLKELMQKLEELGA
jgi:pyrophosphatase PpaX